MCKIEDLQKELHEVKNVEKLIFAGDAAATLTLNDDMYTYGGNTSVIIDDTDVTAALTVTASSLSAANSIDVRSSGFLGVPMKSAKDFLFDIQLEISRL